MYLRNGSQSTVRVLRTKKLLPLNDLEKKPTAMGAVYLPPRKTTKLDESKSFVVLCCITSYHVYLTTV